MREDPISVYRQDASARGRLVDRYAFLVKRIAHHLVARLPDTVAPEDLIQAGMVGLLEAAAKYDDGKGATFETYAGIRIRGAMLDEMRRGDWAPRSVHRHAREVQKAIRAVEARTGRSAQDQEIAAAMGVGLSDYHQMLSDAQGCRLFSYDELVDDDERSDLPADHNVDPCDDVETSSFLTGLAAAIEALPERERLIFALYYDEELNLKEIGAIIEVSESRVSQLLNQATLRLRQRLSDWAEA